MKITPLEIRSQEFKRVMRGFDTTEVRAFLEMVADEFETLNQENLSLSEKVNELNTKLEDYLRMEKTLRETLVTAQKVTAEFEENARKEAELIVKEAEIQAEKLMNDARQEVTRLRKELLQLKGQKESFIAKLRAMVQSQLELLQVLGVEEEITPGEQEELARGPVSKGRVQTASEKLTCQG